jgi:hypothetical protein
MQRRKHYFMTCAALFFLGLIVARPGSTFYPNENKRTCNVTLVHKRNCEQWKSEYRLNMPLVEYQYR